MRIAVTGSSGFIGTALRHHLERDGHTVVRVVRGEAAPGDVHWDLHAGTIDARGLEGLDAVINLAGAGIGDKRWTAARKREILESRTTGTDLLARALAGLATPPPVLVSGSAIGFYGDRGDEQLTEQSSPGHGFLTDVVTAWEAATAPATAAGIRVAHIRTGIALDPSGGVLKRLRSLARFGLLGKLGSGRQWMSWIALDDHIRAMRFVIEHPISGPVDLTAPTPVTNSVFTKALGRALHRPTVLPIPRFGPRLLLGAELADALLFEGQRVLPEVLLEAGFEFDHPELEGALRAVLG